MKIDPLSDPPVRLPEERIAEMQHRRAALLAIQTWRSIQRTDLDRVLADVGDLLSDRAAILRELEEARADVVRMAGSLIGEKCAHHKLALPELERLAMRECPICWKACAEQAEAALARLQAGVREHRDARGDDRCWRDDEALYALLPEGYTPPERDSAVELENCRRFIASRQHPATRYVSPEREIERLRAALARLTQERDRLREALIVEVQHHRHKHHRGTFDNRCDRCLTHQAALASLSRPAEKYHPFKDCAKGCGFDGDVMRFCDKHAPEAAEQESPK